MLNFCYVICGPRKLISYFYQVWSWEKVDKLQKFRSQRNKVFVGILIFLAFSKSGIQYQGRKNYRCMLVSCTYHAPKVALRKKKWRSYFVQFKKHKKHPWRSDTLKKLQALASNCTKSNTPVGIFRVALIFLLIVRSQTACF